MLAKTIRIWIVVVGYLGGAATTVWADPPAKTTEAIVVAAFAESHGGWSADEVLLDDSRRAGFLAACLKQVKLLATSLGVQQTGGQKELTEDEFCEALLHLRKAGSRLPATVQRADRAAGGAAGAKDTGKASETERKQDRTQIAAEIAARQLQDALDCHTDMILVNATARAKFDEFAQAIAADVEPYALRKAAVQLRKSRRLEPELLSRVTDWKRSIREASLEEIRADLDSISDQAGVYLFRDATGYLYIGQAVRLRERMRQHLLESDRVALAGYLAVNDPGTIQIELHEFQAGSPGLETRTRKAYESELIRTRKPRLNLAP